LSDIAFSTPCNGVVVGTRSSRRGAILYTRDGGRHFAVAHVPRGITELKAIATVGRDAWAVGTADGTGVITRSNDAGRSWSAEQEHGSTALTGLTFVDQTHGWAAGGWSLLATDDGRTWHPQQIPHGVYLYTVAFVNRARGWAVGQHGSKPAVIKTTNGGHTWAEEPVAISEEATLFQVDFVNRRDGWATGILAPSTGGVGLLLTTHDGGGTWRRTRLPGTTAIVGLAFASSTRGWIAADAVGGGEIAATANAGGTWRRQFKSPRYAPSSLFVEDAQRAWSTSTDTVYATTDGGA
jgi:photosystem II stability/assembly factor-like uncharacterized protein